MRRSPANRTWVPVDLPSASPLRENTHTPLPHASSEEKGSVLALRRKFDLNEALDELSSPLSPMPKRSLPPNPSQQLAPQAPIGSVLASSAPGRSTPDFVYL